MTWQVAAELHAEAGGKAERPAPGRAPQPMGMQRYPSNRRLHQGQGYPGQGGQGYPGQGYPGQGYPGQGYPGQAAQRPLPVASYLGAQQQQGMPVATYATGPQPVVMGRPVHARPGNYVV